MPTGDQPNLDLIGMVQRARMTNDAEAVPSRVSAVYWIEAKPQEPDQHQPSSRAGHWLIRTTLADVDAVWARIKAATQAGQLGYKSKVATASRSSAADERVIHVMTYDADDHDDVERVRAALAALGCADPLHYERPD
jgi:hypothetical protein